MNRFQLGLVLCTVSALLNVDGIISMFESDGPPAGVGVASAVLGLVTIAGVLLAASGRFSGVPLMGASRVLSAAALGIPAYFIGAPGWVYATVTAGMVLGLTGALLTWSARSELATA
jgi:hypothetical protein